ncbi:hypothetical protein [Bacillus pseudomycoides]|uniref:hypothetical protein n=1 Tax=Bacillus pseudomycoides TaxID=64104 RepID=UPI002E244D70|nr:hypothetical protein [Bacillus pseudomycoides]
MNTSTPSPEPPGNDRRDDDDEQGGICFVRNVLTRSLGETILSLGSTYQIACDFRDVMLKPTSVGSRLLEHYYKHLDTIFSIARKDYSLIANGIQAWEKVLPFANDMLKVPHDQFQLQNITFEKEVHDKIVHLIHKFRSGTKDREFHKAMDEFEEELSKYVGLTSSEAVELLHRKKETDC